MSKDRTELERAQRGDRAAFFALYERHASESWRLGVATGRDLGVAQAAVVNAFARVLGPPHGQDANRFLPVATQLLRVTRETAIDGGPADGPTERSYLRAGAPDTIARAFDGLPERWRSVLWLRHAEHLDLAPTSAVLGLAGAPTEQLGTRALAGLREQLARVQHPDATTPACRSTVVRLGDYADGSLPDADAGKVRRHLDRCEVCRARLDEVDDLTSRLNQLVPDLPLVVEALAADAWLTRVKERSGPIGLRLPSGQLAPAWVERVLAGTTAAVVSLGITAAVMLAARGGGSRPIDNVDYAEATTVGEQALGSEPIDVEFDPLSFPASTSPTGGLFTLPDSSGGTPDATAPAAPSAPASAPASSPAADVPRNEPLPATNPPSEPASPPDATPPQSTPPGVLPPAPPIPVVDDVVGTLDPVLDTLCGSLPVCPAPDELPTLPQIPGL